MYGFLLRSQHWSLSCIEHCPDDVQFVSRPRSSGSDIAAERFRVFPVPQRHPEIQSNSFARLESSFTGFAPRQHVRLLLGHGDGRRCIRRCVVCALDSIARTHRSAPNRVSTRHTCPWLSARPLILVTRKLNAQPRGTERTATRLVRPSSPSRAIIACRPFGSARSLVP